MKELWTKFTEKVGGINIAIAIAIGIILFFVVHPVVGIAAGLVYYAHARGLLTCVFEKAKGLFKKN